MNTSALFKIGYGLYVLTANGHGKDNGCTTLQESIEHWLTNYAGVPKSQIDSFRSIRNIL